MQDDFFGYMSSRLKYTDISVKDVCEGLIDTDILYKYMNQQLSLSKLMMDRILDRMGGSDYDYEYYLLPDEYRLWEERQKIVRALLEGKVPVIDKSDAMYNVKDETEGRLPRQFMYFMKIQAMKNAAYRNSIEKEYCNKKNNNKESINEESGDKKGINKESNYKKISNKKISDKKIGDKDNSDREYIDAEMLREAVQLTVRDFDKIIDAIDNNVSDEKIYSCDFDDIYTTTKRLGCQEIALILDYAMCIARDDISLAIKLCMSFVKYIPQEFNEKIAVVSIYPKAVYCLCTLYNGILYNLKMTDNAKIENAKEYNEESGNCRAKAVIIHELVKLCDDAIKMLGTGLRLNYAWELLVLREKYTGQADRLRWALEYLYSKFGMDIATVNDAYLYIETEVYDAAMVLEVRRRMMSMSKKELCRDLCAEATLYSFINKRRNPHLHTVRIMFDKLGMGTQLVRSDIASESYSDRMNMRVIRKLSAGGEREAVEKANRQLADSLDMTYIQNERFVKRIELCTKRESGLITNQEYAQGLKKLLKKTVDISAILDSENSKKLCGDIFLTGDELICLYNMLSIKIDCNNTELLHNICINYERNFEGDRNEDFQCTRMYNHVNRYALILDYVISVYGSMGAYDKSSDIAKANIIDMLKLRRRNIVTSNMYNIWWNNGEKNGYDADIDEGRKCLEACIILSTWEENIRDINFFKAKFKKIYV